MHLNRVTITGIDETTDIARVLSLSERFPFVEWGVLLSKFKEGKDPRYPRREFIKEFVIETGPTIQRAGHFCGHWSKLILAGNPFPFNHLFQNSFQRIQLNGFTSSSLEWLTISDVLRLPYDTAIILQARNKQDFEKAMALATDWSMFHVLRDPSGGKGVASEDDWFYLKDRVSVGYAGGITPENVESIISTILSARTYEAPIDHGGPGVPWRPIFPAVPIWIDMESGVRTNDRLNLDKVEEVLTKSAPFVL